MARSIVPATFCAARGLGNRHVQTLLPRLRPLAALERDVEILDLPDGDFVELAWVRPAPLADDAPLARVFGDGATQSWTHREAAEAGALPALAAVLHLRPTRFDASATGLTERVGILNPRF